MLNSVDLEILFDTDMKMEKKSKKNKKKQKKAKEKNFFFKSRHQPTNNWLHFNFRIILKN